MTQRFYRYRDNQIAIDTSTAPHRHDDKSTQHQEHYICKIQIKRSLDSPPSATITLHDIDGIPFTNYQDAIFAGCEAAERFIRKTKEQGISKTEIEFIN